MIIYDNFDFDEVCLFSDIHWGKYQDNLRELKNNSDVIDWIIDTYKGTTLIFLGDWFNSRSSVNVNTSNIAYDKIKKLSNKFENVFMVVGNHDAYFKNSVKINSVNQYNDINNIHIISELTLLKTKNSSILLCPWGFDYNNISNQKYDYIMGHLEPSGINLNGEESRGKYGIDDINKLCKLSFIGHYHVRKEYGTQNGTMHCIGCPRQLDWGDYGNTKGYHILNLVGEEIKFIKNNISPKYLKYFWSKLKRGKQKIKSLDILNNYIKLVIDDKYDYEKMSKIIDKLKTFNPIKIECDFLNSINDLNALNSNIEIDNEDLDVKSLLFYMYKFIDKYDLSNLDRKINKDDLKSLIQNYYEKAELEDE